MYNLDSFTKKANLSVNRAFSQAEQLGHTYVGSEHLLLGIFSDGTAKTILKSNNINEDMVLDKVIELVGKGDFSRLNIDSITPTAKRILEAAALASRSTGNKLVGTEHILMAILRESSCCAVNIIRDVGGSISKLYNDCTNANSIETDKKFQSEVKLPTLSKYGRDLTVIAAQKKCDPVIARDHEIERVIQVLTRRTKNNPCLIGEAGVGKTAIAEGIAQLLYNGDIPESIKGKHLFSLDLSSMLAGAKYRGDFEDRIKTCIDEVIKAGNIILFIDEIHTIVGAGAAEGAIDAANILKPQLARGELQIIGATTLEEYRKHIEKDSALERRFQPIIIGEPSPENAVEILKGLREKYEKHHNVTITDEAINTAVTLSVRYITDRFLPDKALDLIDEASSRVRLKAAAIPQNLKELSDVLNSILDDKSNLADEKDSNSTLQATEGEALLRNKIKKGQSSSFKQTSQTKEIVSENDIAEIVSSWTGIPVKQMTEQESERLLKLENILHNRVIGQDEAVSSVSKAIRRSRVGLKDPKRPIGSFLFLGPTGVGKTELCKALAESLFDDENAIIRLDMSEYMEKHSVSKLLGSPPGYVGFEEGGQLTEKVRRKPYSVVLFDEIEKAHSDIFNILLQIFEDGILTDSQGKRVDFKNTVIILTSNVGARLITEKKNLGFTSQDKKEDNSKAEILEELKRCFKPEFLNRIDDIIVFKKLLEPEIECIATKLLDQLRQRAFKLGIIINFSEEAVKNLSARGFDNNYGARPLRRVITSEVEDLLSQKVLEGEVKSGDVLELDVVNGKFVFTERLPV